MTDRTNATEKEYAKIYNTSCPKDGSKTTHTAIYSRATCSRFRENMLWFACEKNADCQECREDYE